MSQDALVLVMGANLALLVLVVFLLLRIQRHRDDLDRHARAGRAEALRSAELDHLSIHLQRANERERAQLARRLHDELGGILTSAKMDIDWLRTRCPGEAQAARFAQLGRLMDEAVVLKRQVIEELRPSLLDNLGLTHALEWHVAERCDAARVPHVLDLPDDLPEVPGDAAIALYRIAQQAVDNAVRHAHCRMVTVRLSPAPADGALTLEVEDDGFGMPAGFDPANLPQGLSGMRQRARALGGDVTWARRDGGGTRVTATVPLRAAPAPV